MDQHDRGFISINSFSNWVRDNCGFHINDEDLPGLETILDGTNDYRISREGFIETISVAADDEEGDNFGASFKASASASKTPNKNNKQATVSASKFNNSSSARKQENSAGKQAAQAK